MRVLLAFLLGVVVTFGLLGLIAGCGSSTFTGPNSVIDNWHGNRVLGYNPEETMHALEEAWPEVNRRFPGWTPVGWVFYSHSERFPCPEFGTCRGRMVGPVREIHLSWVGGYKDVVQIAKWEMCNAARWEMSGRPKVGVDKGCGS
jgi:hypothetical protein